MKSFKPLFQALTGFALISSAALCHAGATNSAPDGTLSTDGNVGDIEMQTYNRYTMSKVPALLQEPNAAFADPMCLQRLLNNSIHKSYLAVGQPLRRLTAKRDKAKNDLVLTLRYEDANLGYGAFMLEVRAHLKFNINQGNWNDGGSVASGQSNPMCLIRALPPIDDQGGPL